MNISAQEILTKDLATPELNRLDQLIKSGAASRVAGRAAVQAIKSHLFAFNDSHPNKLGGPRTNFYGQMARSTNASSENVNKVLISIAHVGARQRYEGGTIRPVNGGVYLTIAATAEAYGRRAREMSNLKFGFAQDSNGWMRPALIEQVGNVIRGRNKCKRVGKAKGAATLSGKVMFWLIREAHQVGDTTILPQPIELAQIAAESIRKLLERRTEKEA